MKRTTCVLTRFDLGNGFYVEVAPSVEKNITFSMCHNDYGYKMFMYSMTAEDCHEEIWEEMIAEDVEDYIDMFVEDMEKLESECDCECCNCEGSAVWEAIEMHNEHVDKMQALGNALLEQYPDVEETPVNDAFCEAYQGIVGNAIYLCCEANSHNEGCKWMTTGDWHVVEG